MKAILEDIANVEKDYKKLQLTDHNEMSFLKQQVVQLNGEKQRIEQNTIVLDGRINAIEHEVGFEWMNE